jgi:hypothetical protein
MNTQKKPSRFADRRRALVGSASTQPSNPSSSQKTGGVRVEKFGYNKLWKTARLLNGIYPAVFLVAIVAIYIFIIAPSGGMVEFKWWMPLLVIALIVWAVIEILNYRKTLSYSVELSEETIRVSGVEAKWADITKVEKSKMFGNNFEITLHTQSGTRLNIPVQTEGLAYINGFVDSHTKNLEGR